MKKTLSTAIEHWPYIAPLVACPKNETELNMLINHLDELLSIVGNDENHRLMGLVDVLSHVIQSYEASHYPIAKGKGVEALKFLMQSHKLRQTDLPEVATQGVLSEILAGKRKLNLRQIKQLAKRFHVSPTTFIDN